MIFGSRDPKTLVKFVGRAVVGPPYLEVEFAEPPTLTHEHNQILAAFRAYCSEFRIAPVQPAADQWLFAFASFDTFGGYELWEHPKNTYHSLTVAAPDQIEHARAVLTRLAGWQS